MNYSITPEFDIGSRAGPLHFTVEASGSDWTAAQVLEFGLTLIAKAKPEVTIAAVRHGETATGGVVPTIARWECPREHGAAMGETALAAVKAGTTPHVCGCWTDRPPGFCQARPVLVRYTRLGT